MVRSDGRRHRLAPHLLPGAGAQRRLRQRFTCIAISHRSGHSRRSRIALKKRSNRGLSLLALEVYSRTLAQARHGLSGARADLSLTRG
jgi:hypothetical protein